MSLLEEGIEEPLRSDEESLVKESDVGNNRLHERIKAVRSEVVNAISFLSVLLTLQAGFWFELAGILVFLLDCYFIYHQWMLRTHMELPTKLKALLPQKLERLDDLICDLPQSLWVVGYLLWVQFSVLGFICAVHSVFSIVEDLTKTTNRNL